MITHLSVKDFQSLASLDLPLEQFTVIVGPSSSGKSAFTRALRTLTANARGTSFVSSWATKTEITADLTERPDPTQEPSSLARGSVRLTRSPATKDNSYEILPPPGPLEDAPPSLYTKLGGTTPPEVSQFLGIDPSHPTRNLSLHFASQFDRPFLLDSSPAENARTFAALTNVQVVFAAAREAKRQRLSTNATLKIRTTDLAAITARTEEFTLLQAQRAALTRAEQAHTTATDLRTQIKNLESALSSLQTAEIRIAAHAPHLAVPLPHDAMERATMAHHQAQNVSRTLSILSTHTETITRTAAILSSPLPSLDKVLIAQERRESFRSTLITIRDTRAAHSAAQEALGRHERAQALAHEAYQETLRSAGTCPTCLQSTADLTLHDDTTHRTDVTA